MLQALWEWPEERRRLAADESLIPTAVEELLRWVSPVMQFRRTATRDVELEGHQVRAGDKLVLYYIAANRDEAVFERPDRLDLGRTPNPHLAFGVGPHFCLGAHLSRFEAASLLTALRPHLVRLSPAGPPTRMASNFMNGWKSLPARFAS
jgi:cytochrome P450